MEGTSRLIIYARETRNPSDSRRKRFGEENDADYAEEKGRVVTIETQPASGRFSGLRSIGIGRGGRFPAGGHDHCLPLCGGAGVGGLQSDACGGDGDRES